MRRNRAASADTAAATPLDFRNRKLRAQDDAFDSGWTLIDRIGQGGFGEVFEAERGIETAAVKLCTHSNGETVERWALRAVGYHPNVVKYLEAGDGWLAMGFVDGIPMADTIMVERDAVAMVLDVARALAHCHSRGVLHLDVKPANVVLTDTQAVLVDFGLARPVGSEVDEQTGTPGYVSPEVLDCFDHTNEVDERADVYALGCLLHYAIQGWELFADESPVQMLRAQMKGERSNAVAGPLGEVIDRATELRVEDRYRTVEDFSAALKAAARG